MVRGVGEVPADQPVHAEPVRGRERRVVVAHVLGEHGAVRHGVTRVTRGGPVVAQSAAGPRVVQGEEGGHGPVQGAGPIHKGQPGGQPRAPLEGQLGPGGGGPPPELPGGPADEDVVTAGVQHPVVPLPWVVVVPRHLNEALIEAEVVSDGVLPALLVLPVVREVFHDELVDAVQGEPFLRALPNRHHDQCVVTKRRFFVLAALLLSVLPSGVSLFPVLLLLLLLLLLRGALLARRVTFRLRFPVLLHGRERSFLLGFVYSSGPVEVILVEVLVVVLVLVVVVVALHGLGHQTVYTERRFRNHFHLFALSHIQHHRALRGENGNEQKRRTQLGLNLSGLCLRTRTGRKEGGTIGRKKV